MLILYVKTGCLYCAKVLDTGRELGLSFEEKNIADPAVAEDLVERGGKRLVPYLVDEDHAIEMYDSDVITTYLREHYSPTMP